ncbi:MAG: hypothetical protein KDE33_20250 [Bacteroidetes bacterium]|nr:hypothetical protein [Bacteroidota bacterium]
MKFKIKSIKNEAISYYDRRESIIKKLITIISELIGYIHFSFKVTGENQKIYVPQNLYSEIFQSLFREYYPHEHLDRSYSKKRYYRYIDKILEGTAFNSKAFDERHLISDEKGRNDVGLYKYIEEGLLFASTELIKLDKEWCIDTFHKTKEERKKLNQIEWHTQLARLGKVLHVVEDFFAHSTFIDNALQILLQKKYNGDSLDPKYIPSVLEEEKYQRSLKKFNPDKPDLETNILDEYLQTGYFDSKDTFVSLLHLVEEKLVSSFEIPAEKYSSKVDKTINSVFKYEIPLSKILENIINEISEKIKKDYESKALTYTTLFDFKGYEFMKEETLRSIIGVENSDGFIITTLTKCINVFFNIFLGFLVTLETAKKAKVIVEDAKKVIKLVEYLISIYYTPNLIRVILRDVAKETFESFIGKVLFTEFFHTFFHDMEEGIGANRLGCHSLLAKDEELRKISLYKFTEECAKYVDQAILKYMIVDERAKDEKLDFKIIDWSDFFLSTLKHPKKYYDTEEKKQKINFYKVAIHLLKRGDNIYHLLNKYALTSEAPFDIYSSRFFELNSFLPKEITIYNPDLHLPINRLFIPFQKDTVFINYAIADAVTVTNAPWFEDIILGKTPIYVYNDLKYLNPLEFNKKTKEITELKDKREKEFREVVLSLAEVKAT